MRSTQARLTLYQRIVGAARRGRGLRLSADECRALAGDTAIATRAAMDNDGCDDEWHGIHPDEGPSCCPTCGDWRSTAGEQ